MINKKLYYNGTDIDVRLGDKILYKVWYFVNKPATVVYVPAQSKSDWLDIGDDQWAIKIDDEDDEYLVMGYFPDIGEIMPKKITFVSRGEVSKEIKKMEEKWRTIDEKSNK